MASPPTQNRVNGSQRGPTEARKLNNPIAMNQKAVGSSPAERASEIPVFAGSFSLPLG
jgi:hypothetical protein